MEARLTDALVHQIGGVHVRLDLLNGRTRKTEERAAEHGVRLGSLEAAKDRILPEGTTPLTRRDLAVASGSIVTVVAIGLWFLNVMGKL